MISLKLVLLPIISAFIGWFTNWIAVKMLFHPKQPKRILGVTFHGIFPKRQKQFAAKLGTVVASELININELTANLKDPKNLATVKPYIEEHVDAFLNVKLKEKLPVISMFVGSGTLDKIKEGLLEEIDVLLPEVIGKYADNLNAHINIEKIVSDKVENFSSDKLEEILVAIMNKEFKFVEIIGGVLGLLIGLLQVLLTIL